MNASPDSVIEHIPGFAGAVAMICQASPQNCPQQDR